MVLKEDNTLIKDNILEKDNILLSTSPRQALAYVKTDD